MRYRKKAMIVAPQPEPTEAGADILRAGGNAVDAAHGLRAGAGRGRSADVRHRRLRQLRHLHAGQGVPRLHRLPRAGAARRPPRHVGRPDRVARRATATASSCAAGSTTSATSRSARRPACGCTATRTGARQPAVGADRRAGDRLGRGRLDGAAARRTTGGRTTAQMGRAPNHERLASRRPRRALYCRPDGTPKRVGDRVVNRDLRPDAARHRQARRRRLLRGRDRPRHRRGHAQPRRRCSRSRTSRRGSTVRNAPLWGTYRGYRVSTNRPPGGGVMLLEMLNILEHFDLAGLEHNSAEYIRVVAEAMKRATIDKDRHVGDPEVRRRAGRAPDRQGLRGRPWPARSARGVKAEVPRFNAGARRAKDTTHISVLDEDGNCVTMTHSLGMPSGVVTTGLGFMYNGCMGVFDPRPGRAGQPRAGQGALQLGGARPSSSRTSEPHLVIGAPGATQIAMGVLQVLLNALDFDMTMVEAVSAPRFSATSDAIDVSNRIPRGVERELEAQGYEVVRSPNTYGFAAVHAHPRARGRPRRRRRPRPRRHRDRRVAACARSRSTGPLDRKASADHAVSLRSWRCPACIGAPTRELRIVLRRQRAHTTVVVLQPGEAALPCARVPAHVRRPPPS